MGICANHHTAGERIVFQYYLVNDPCSRFPEADTIFIRNRREEVIYFFIYVYGYGKILFCPYFCLYEVIAMHGRGYSYPVSATGHKLQQRHLGSGILHGNTVGRKIHIIFTALVGFCCRFVQMGIQYFFSKC